VQETGSPQPAAIDAAGACGFHDQAREVISRLLKELEVQGRLELQRGSIRILDRVVPELPADRRHCHRHATRVHLDSVRINRSDKRGNR